MKLIYLLIFTLLFSGCNLLESQDDKDKKIASQKMAFEKKVEETKEIQLKKLSAQTQKELAILDSKKELATIQKEKELEKIRLQTELEKQKIVLDMEKEQAIFEQKMLQKEQLNNMELKRYLMLVFGLFIVVGSFFIFYYFKKRREDKLRAYNDNLQKYFNQKENEARVKIAQKMLDTIASGKLDKMQENQLINAFSGEANNGYQQQLIEDKNDDIDITTDIELVEKPNK
ncbi:MAG: hypothetical protein U9P72_10720 [Campylobacterota bacterium]|nr:hypothetical protein [Campylobacterota bacterium]